MFESIKNTQRYSIILKLHIFEGKNEIEKRMIYSHLKCADKLIEILGTIRIEKA